jgi:hypothetical protein
MREIEVEQMKANHVLCMERGRTIGRAMVDPAVTTLPTFARPMIEGCCPARIGLAREKEKSRLINVRRLESTKSGLEMQCKLTDLSCMTSASQILLTNRFFDTIHFVLVTFSIFHR